MMKDFKSTVKSFFPTPLKSRIKRLLPRAFEVYSVGDAKTSSTSIASIWMMLP